MTRTKTAMLAAGAALALSGGLGEAVAQPVKGLAAPRVAATQNASELVVGPAPDWVVDAEPVAPRDGDLAGVQGGVYYALLDTQSRLEETATHSYRRSALTVTGRAGLEEAGRFSVGFDPSDSDLIVHHIRLSRPGEAPRDVLADMTIEAARQEARLDQGVKDGTITLFGEIPGLRVGDTVDVATSLIERTPSWPGRMSGGFYMEWSVPVGLNRFRVLTPEGTRLTLAAEGDVPAPTVTRTDGVAVHEWRRVHGAPRQPADAVPQDVAEFARVTYSNWEDWNAVARWGAELYERDLTLPDEVKARLKASRRRPKDARITEAIRIAQDDIRYVSDVMGLGAYEPRPPRTTWANGYGDCKDKALLLVAMLREIGVRADVVLANTQVGDALGTVAPTPAAFDHVIVRVGRGRKTVFVDATHASQGGTFPNLVQPDFGYLLPLTEDGALTRPAVALPKDRLVDVTETFDFGAKDGSATLTVSTLRTGGVADGFRQQAEAQSVAMISESYLTFYRGLYPGIEEVAEIAIEDDRDANRSVVTERYRIPADAVDALRPEFGIYASGAMIGLPDHPPADRVLPLALPHPVKARHQVRLLNTAMPFDDEAPVRHEVGPLAFAVTAVAMGNDLTVTYDIETTGDRIEPADLAAYGRAYTAWDRERSVSWSLPRDLKEAMRMRLEQ